MRPARVARTNTRGGYALTETRLGNPREQRTAALIILAALALAAFFLAQGTTGLVAASLLPLRPAPAPTPRVAARAPRRVPTSDEQILRRNIFDPSTGDVFELPSVASMDEGLAPVIPWEHGQPTEACAAAGLRLVGAVVSPNTPEWSFAALAPEGQPKAMLYRAGMSVGTSQLLEVQRDRVVVRPSSGAACHVAMFVPGAATPAPAGSAAPAAAAPQAAIDQAAGETATNDELTQGITQLSESEYNVSRELVTRLMANQGDLMRMARVIPHEENGQVKGVKLYGIRRSSLLGRLGIRNGDMVRSINGMDMTNPDAAVQAMSQLSSASELSLSLERRGQATTRTYHLQ